MKFKFLIILLSFFAFSNKVTAQNFVMVESQQGYPNETNIFQILLKNNDSVRAVQFDVELPNGFNLDVNSVATTARTGGFSVASSYLGGTTYRVVLFSTNNLMLAPGDLSILTFPSLIDENITPGEYVFDFSNVIISDTTNQNISSTPLEIGEVIIVVANSPSPMELCDEAPNDEVGVFDLTIRESQILGIQTDCAVTYHQSQSDANSGVNSIATPSSYPNSMSPEVVYPRITNLSNGYFDTTMLTLTIVPAPNPATPIPLELCDDNSDGIAMFDLSLKTDEIINGETNISISYHETLTDATNGLNEIISPYVNTTPFTQTIFARVEGDLTACSTIVELVLNVNSLPEVNTISDYILEDINDDGIEIFNLTTRIPEILGSQNSSDFQVIFYESLADAQADENVIVEPTTYVNTSNPQTIYLRITDIVTNCISLNEFIVFVDSNLGNKDYVISKIILYPNPTSGKLFIEGIFESEIQVKIYTTIGQEIFSNKLNQHNGLFSIDMSDLKVGLYFVDVSFSEIRQIIKIIKN